MNPDRSMVTGIFRQPRLFAGRVGLAAQYEDRSDGRLGFTELSRPFFSLSARSSWRVGAEARSERILRFFGGSDIARDTLQHRFAVGYSALGWALRAGTGGYLRVGVSGQLRRDNYSAEARVDTLGSTITGAVGGFLQWRRAAYLVSHRLEGLAPEGDGDARTAPGLGRVDASQGVSDDD